MVNLRCPVCAGALEKRAGAYLCPKNHSFDIAKSGYVNLLLNSSQGHHGDDKLMVRARRDFLDKGYYDRFIAAGINQTKHQILLEVDVSVSILLPGITTYTKVSNEISVAETVIVGGVPQTYTYFSTTEDKIEDYADEYIMNNG